MPARARRHARARRLVRGARDRARAARRLRSTKDRMACTYKATAKNRKTLRRYKAGKSIGFTQKASLKAKGLLTRSNGRRFVSGKYCGK